jgi:hypothetical protein
MTGTGTIATLVARDRALRDAGRAPAERARRLAALRAWQSRRLARTYADLARQPRFRAAVEYFLAELYGEEDVAPRDTDLERAGPLLERALPAGARGALTRALELEILSQELDLAMVDALAAAGAPVLPDGADYARAYRTVGRRADRERQIDALASLGEYLDTLVHRPGVALLVRLARPPAHAAGLGALHDFLERGYGAFAAMGGAAEFVATVRERETRLLERLFAGQADPFTGDD